MNRRRITNIYAVKGLAVLFFVTLFSLNSFAQDKKAELLDRLYQQGYYQRVLKKSSKFIDKKGYKGDAFIHMFQVASLLKLKKDKDYASAHQHLDTKIDAAVNGWKMAPNYKRSLQTTFLVKNDLKEVISNKSDQDLVPNNPKKVKDTQTIRKPKKGAIIEDSTNDILVLDTTNLSIQDKIIMYAETYIGVPYKYGGKSDKGFDCSGYTCHVLEEFGYSLPRSASDQHAYVKKIPLKKASKGDLVFFSHRRNVIAHVGIVVSEPGEDLTMIHASSSKGIMISNIEKSTYWKPRLKTAGRIIDYSSSTLK